MNDLIICAQQNFVLRFGDMNAIGWAITLNYFYCVGLIIYMMRKLLPRLHPAERRLYRQFWTFAAIVYFLLGMNKQLDMQTVITNTGRCISQIEGWYDVRRNFQMTAILSGVLACTVGLFAVKWHFRHISHRLRLAFLGLALSAVFVVLRAVSFHHVDQIFNMRLIDIKLHSYIEILAILLVATNAVMLAFKRTRRRSTNDWRFARGAESGVQSYAD